MTLKKNLVFEIFIALLAIIFSSCGNGNTNEQAARADLILYNGKIVVVDSIFSIHSAMAIKGNRIMQVGGKRKVLKLKGPGTELLDLHGRMVLPGIIDSHTHPVDAAMSEFDHPIPEMETIRDVLDYIHNRAQINREGEWIVVKFVFITRLKEQRYPTRAELDSVAPRHPVMFSTGPDAALNSLALKLSGIDKNFKVTDGGAGFVEKDEITGDLTGIIRNCNRFVKVRTSEKTPDEEERMQQMIKLFRDYNSVGITNIGDRDPLPSDLELYKKLRASGQLTVRVACSQHIETLGPIDEVQANIRRVADDPLFKEKDNFLKIIGIKTYMDGGMLTGSAYMSEPWGVSKIYGITDPQYRGILYITHEKLLPIVCTAVESGLQVTSHTVGDGAVHELLEVYKDIYQTMPAQLRKTRPCISHSNFMSRESVNMLPQIGVSVDIQPAWLYLDTHTLLKQFGYDRLRWFQPLKSIFETGAIAGGGSDHIIKIGSLRSVNPYNPFLGMATTITRRAKWYDQRLHPEEALSREQAIRFYTINNAWLLFSEDQLGSLEPGKLADFVVLDTDLLTCPADEIQHTKVLKTYLDGKLIFSWE
jgi:predicted amidohydrolase YtcJ